MSPTILRMLMLYNNLYFTTGATGQESFRRTIRPSAYSMEHGVFKNNDRRINLPMRPRYGCIADHIAVPTVNSDF